MIVLDTDIISLLDRQAGQAYESLVQRLSASDVGRVCVSIVSFEEQMRGWLSYIAASRTVSRQIEGYSRLHRMLRWYNGRKSSTSTDPPQNCLKASADHVSKWARWI